MGYLNNSTRILDAILTKKGREILSSGGDFDVTKFALGDDEIDYSLWDTSHTQGTDYYGAVIENLPALEPFNDPSEIMKYKLVTRSENTRAMALLEDLISLPTATGLRNLEYNEDATTDNRVGLDLTTSTIGISTAKIGIKHHNNTNLFSQGTDYEKYWDELYTITLLDASVAVLAPNHTDNMIDTEGSMTTGDNPVPQLENSDLLWVPYVDNVQHISQTISGVAMGTGDLLRFPGGAVRDIVLYPKQISADTSTSIIITGEKSGAVIEFPVEIEFQT
jgi:hypothetical protein